MYEKCILLVCFCVVLATTLTAKIRNGYGPDVASARHCLQLLNDRLLANPDMPDAERRRINNAIKKHMEVIAHYELTEALLRQIQMISPVIYADMDKLQDKRNRETDIYVRFIPEQMASVKLTGASFFWVSASDKDASQSMFGEYTVAIDVWICDGALNVLAHEFGHTKFIVPNLAAYHQFYHEAYSHSKVSSHVGHSRADASGHMAYAFGQQYLRDRRAFRIHSGRSPQGVHSIIKKVRRQVHDTLESGFNEFIAASNSFE